MKALLAFLLALAAAPSHAQLTVIDGDSLRINRLTVRLWALDAPELAQECNGWQAGQYAAAVLRGLLQARQLVYCAPRGEDRYGRVLAVCMADGLDVGAELVRQGMAWAFVRYSRDYEHQERYARDLGLGIHGARCIPAWQWRQERR